MTISEILEEWHNKGLFVQIFNSPKGSIRYGSSAWVCNVVGADLVRGEGASMEESIFNAKDQEK